MEFLRELERRRGAPDRHRPVRHYEYIEPMDVKISVNGSGAAASARVGVSTPATMTRFVWRPPASRASARVRWPAARRSYGITIIRHGFIGIDSVPCWSCVATLIVRDDPVEAARHPTSVGACSELTRGARLVESVAAVEWRRRAARPGAARCSPHSYAATPDVVRSGSCACALFRAGVQAADRHGRVRLVVHAAAAPVRAEGFARARSKFTSTAAASTSPRPRRWCRPRTNRGLEVGDRLRRSPSGGACVSMCAFRANAPLPEGKADSLRRVVCDIRSTRLIPPADVRDAHAERDG